MRSRVRELTGILSPGVLTDAEIDRFVNEANMTVLAARDWPFLVEQVSSVLPAGDSVATFTPSATAHRVVDVFSQTDSSGKAVEMFERSAPLIAEPFQGRPREFSWDAASSSMTVFPAPTSETLITARVVVEPSEMVDDKDTSPIPERFAASIPFLASARILEREGDKGERAKSFEERCWELVGDMVRVLLTSSRKTVVLGGRKSGRRGLRRQVW